MGTDIKGICLSMKKIIDVKSLPDKKIFVKYYLDE